ncbi:unnamed protein product [Rotaria magnacalcarata]|uniref:G-protein coupled receptors family 1 profile domain-containing protein n=4 Tax=Rotaria magnacalcarata TaxID=392030 RepID=A0A816RYY0_9BILA|nr:unnamed protein product [Rotaria magnacalcarata]
MGNTANNFDRFLPLSALMANPDVLFHNLSLTLESVASTSMWNRTELFVPIGESVILYRHPILYGAAIYALLLIIVGTIGNVLTIIVLLRPNLQRYTTMRYLIAVAVADLSSLYSWNLNLFYKHLINHYQNDLEDGSMIACRFVSFIAFVSLQLSSWYLTLVSVDRCLNTYFLFWHRQIGRASYSIYIILSITIAIIFLNLHLLFLNGYQQSNCIPYEKRTCFICYARLEDRFYIFPKWEKVHLIVYNFIPFAIMFISTCFIIRRSTSSTNAQRRFTTGIRKDSLQCSSRRRKQRQLTHILFSVTFLFVFLTTPIMIYNVFFRNSLKNRKPLKYIVQAVLLCTQYTSHAINFFVYCYGASNFRHELGEFFSDCTRKKKKTLNPARTREQLL